MPVVGGDPRDLTPGVAQAGGSTALRPGRCPSVEQIDGEGAVIEVRPPSAAAAVPAGIGGQAAASPASGLAFASLNVAIDDLRATNRRGGRVDNHDVFHGDKPAEAHRRRTRRDQR